MLCDLQTGCGEGEKPKSSGRCELDAQISEWEGSTDGRDQNRHSGSPTGAGEPPETERWTPPRK